MSESELSTSAGSPTALVVVGSSRLSLCRRLEAKWDEIQVGRQGSYSVERLESLDLYCKSTSRARVIMVCLITPLPALLVAVLLECFPLRPPSDGWAANWVFWLRLLLAQVILGSVVNSQIVRFVPGLNFPLTKRVAIAAGVSTSLVGSFILVATKIGFPVPCMTNPNWNLHANSDTSHLRPSSVCERFTVQTAFGLVNSLFPRVHDA